MIDERPAPRPSILSQPFWDSTAQHRLIRPYCLHCKVSFFPPQLCCSLCLEKDWIWVPSEGLGTVYSHTTVYRAPLAGFDVPYVLAIVDLEDGFSMMTNVVGIDPDDVSIGIRVAVQWEVRGDICLPVFAPDIGRREPS